VRGSKVISGRGGEYRNQLLQGIGCRPSGFEPIIFMSFLLLNLLNNTEFSRSLYTDVTHADLQSEHFSSVSGTIRY
jgi:hypothetical protein